MRTVINLWCVRFIVRLGCAGSTIVQVICIGAPAFWNFYRDQARQCLLLTGPVHGGEFAADGDGRCGDRVLHGAARAQVRLHGLEVVVMSPSVRRVIGIVVITRGTGGTAISGVLLAGSYGQTLDAFALTGRVSAVSSAVEIPTVAVVVRSTSSITWRASTVRSRLPRSRSGEPTPLGGRITGD